MSKESITLPTVIKYVKIYHFENDPIWEDTFEDRIKYLHGSFINYEFRQVDIDEAFRILKREGSPVIAIFADIFFQGRIQTLDFRACFFHRALDGRRHPVKNLLRVKDRVGVVGICEYYGPDLFLRAEHVDIF